VVQGQQLIYQVHQHLLLVAVEVLFILLLVTHQNWLEESVEAVMELEEALHKQLQEQPTQVVEAVEVQVLLQRLVEMVDQE
jgi:hypothetical protein